MLYPLFDLSTPYSCNRVTASTLMASLKRFLLRMYKADGDDRTDVGNEDAGGTDKIKRLLRTSTSRRSRTCAERPLVVGDMAPWCHRQQ